MIENLIRKAVGMVRIIEKLHGSVVLVIPGTGQGHQCLGAASR